MFPFFAIYNILMLYSFSWSHSRRRLIAAFCSSVVLLLSFIFSYVFLLGVFVVMFSSFFFGLVHYAFFPLFTDFCLRLSVFLILLALSRRVSLSIFYLSVMSLRLSIYLSYYILLIVRYHLVFTFLCCLGYIFSTRFFIILITLLMIFYIVYNKISPIVTILFYCLLFSFIFFFLFLFFLLVLVSVSYYVKFIFLLRTFFAMST